MIHTRTHTIHDLQVRSEQDQPTRVEGYAVLFDVPSEPLWELGGAREIIAPGAFTRALSEGDDVRLLINHDPNLILARSTSGTLQMRQDDRGLWFSASLPDTSYASDLKISMQRKDVTQNSFGFQIDDQSWETRDGEQFSVVKNVHLRDLSIVTYPAYTATFSELRSVTELLNNPNPSDRERDVLHAFFAKHRAALNISVSTQPEGVPSQTDASVDAVARRNRQLQLLELDA